jgi:hypothetical protein
MDGSIHPTAALTDPLYGDVEEVVHINHYALGELSKMKI